MAGGNIAALAVVMALASSFAIGQGLSYPLLSFTLVRQGVPPWLIGLNTAMMPLGLIASAPLVPILARKLGPARLAFLSALMLAGLLAVIGAFQSLEVWFPARLLLGCAINGLYVTSETWVNQLATPERRGRILGIYATAMSLGFALGPFVLIVTGTEGWPPFLVGIGLALAIAAALLAVRRKLPGLDGQAASSVRAFLPLAPFLLATVLVVAAYEQAALSLLPVFGTLNDLPQNIMAISVGMLIVGNIAVQVPIGWLVDAWSQRGVMILLAAIGAGGAVLLPFAVADIRLLWPLLFVWGAAAYSVYTIALIELGTRFEGSLLLAGNAAFSAMWGIGGIIGPPVSGAAMDALGPNGLPLILGTLYVGLLAAAILRREAARRLG